MGEHIKQLLPWKDTNLLGHAIKMARGVTDTVYVVLGAYEDEIKTALETSVHLISNPDWKAGMGTVSYTHLTLPTIYSV